MTMPSPVMVGALVVGTAAVRLPRVHRIPAAFRRSRRSRRRMMPFSGLEGIRRAVHGRRPSPTIFGFICIRCSPCNRKRTDASGSKGVAQDLDKALATGMVSDALHTHQIEPMAAVLGFQVKPCSLNQSMASTSLYAIISIKRYRPDNPRRHRSDHVIPNRISTHCPRQ